MMRAYLEIIVVTGLIIWGLYVSLLWGGSFIANKQMLTKNPLYNQVVKMP